jgi:hypothetical protein
MINTLATLLVLAADRPSFEEKYFTECYEAEDSATCRERQQRWKAKVAEYEAEEKKFEADDFEFFVKETKTTLAPTGSVKMEAQKPFWCQGAAKVGFRWTEVPRYFTNLFERNEWDYARSIGQKLCERPNDATVQKVVGVLLQYEANKSNVPADEVLRNFGFKMNLDLPAKQKQVCALLPIDEEAMAGTKIFADAERLFFGCNYTNVPLWNSNPGQMSFKDVLWYLDSAAQPAAEFHRLVFLLDSLMAPAEDDPYKAQSVARWAWLAYDVKNFDVVRLKKEFAEKPYAKNEWAQLVLSESLGNYASNAKAFEAAVNKIAKDDDWKNIVFNAPVKGIKDWEAQTEKYKSAFDNARDFEAKLFSPSLKAAQGCSSKLKADFHAWLKTVKAKPSEFDNAVAGDAVGSYLLQHLAACEMAEKNPHGRLLDQARKAGRLTRGPRLAAYYAMLEAAGQVKADRPKFPLNPKQLSGVATQDLENRAAQAAGEMGYYNEGKGSVVKSVSKVAAGLKVTFVTESRQYMSQSCAPTNRILRIDASGNVVYYTLCRETGMKTSNERLEDTVIPLEYATGIAPGRWVEYSGAFKLIDMPMVVYSDKSKSKIVNWRGFGL